MSGTRPWRVPIESRRPIVIFALARLGLALLALGVAVLLDFHYGGRLVAVVAGVALPWSAVNLAYARRSPEGALNPLIALGDIVMLVAIEAVVPQTYGPVHFMALAFLAVHAHFQGERIGSAVAVLAALTLVSVAALRPAPEVRGELLALYESVFTAAALTTVVLVGRFRTTESSSRLRARELTRRALTDEREVRRRVSESLHDGPVQEMIGLDMALAAARREAERHGAEGAVRMIGEAHEAATRTIEGLRAEMLDLGPYAYEEFSLEVAVERCSPVWERRHELATHVEIESLDIPSEMEGELFRITQEAVMNAARHGQAANVTISVTEADGVLRLAVSDDGTGFGGVDPLGPTEPGHIGLASVRERTELMDGELEIESSDQGSTVTVTVPLPRAV